MAIIHMTVEIIECISPASRGGLMVANIACDMTESQIFQAIQSMRGAVTSATWGDWMDQWVADGEFPHIAEND